MKLNNSDKILLSADSKLNLILILVLLPYYFAVWGKLGQKFAAATGISLLCGVTCWFIMLICHQPTNYQVDFGDNNKSESSKNEKTEVDLPDLGNETETEIPFCWQLFLLFPMFYPLGLSLWLIFPLLVVSYLLSVSSFGGYRRHFFNPVVVAVILMLVGYGYTASLAPSKPLSTSEIAYKTWSSGVPGNRTPWQLIEKVPIKEVFSMSFASDLPGMAGSAYPFILLTLSAYIVFVLGQCRAWWLSSIFSLLFFALIGNKYGHFAFSPLHPIFLGLVPALMLITVADKYTIAERVSEQVISGLLFGILTLLFIVKSGNFLASIYALLLMRVLSPLISDILLPDVLLPSNYQKPSSILPSSEVKDK